MENKLFSMVDGESLLQWLLILFLVGLFIYKEWPGFWARVKSKAQGELREDTITARLDRIEADVAEIKEKLGRDYNRINDVELRQDHVQKVMKDIKKEQAIIMRALLGTLKGLQELGANGPTKEAQAEIVEYLNDQAHDGGD